MGDPSDFVGVQRMTRIVSVSGGKDSTALYLWALERQRPFLAVFADTGNEAQQTYDYLHEIPMKTGGPAIRWIKAYTVERVERKARNLLRTFEEAGKWGKGEKAVAVTREMIEQALTVHETYRQPIPRYITFSWRVPVAQPYGSVRTSSRSSPCASKFTNRSWTQGAMS